MSSIINIPAITDTDLHCIGTGETGVAGTGAFVTQAGGISGATEPDTCEILAYVSGAGASTEFQVTNFLGQVLWTVSTTQTGPVTLTATRTGQVWPGANQALAFRVSCPAGTNYHWWSVKFK